MTDRHASAELIRRYVTGRPLPADLGWALETHLETCAGCRSRLAAAAPPELTALVDTVGTGLGPLLTTQPAPPRRRPIWLAGWLTRATVPWLVTTVLITMLAVLLDQLRYGAPSLILLLSPVMPVIAVVVAWSGGLDPAHELVAASARAGLPMVLRRTTVALLVLAPVLAVANWLSGTSVLEWLIPGLAFAVGTLALGGLVGVTRAAIGLAALWGLFVVAPTVATERMPVVLSPAGLPGWAGAIVLGAVLLIARRRVYRQLGSGR